MAAISLQSAPVPLNDSIFTLLDQSWYAQPILNLSVAASVPLSGVNSATSSAVGQSVDHGHMERQKMNGDGRRYCSDEAEMRRVFDVFDKNADGVISGDELRRYMRCCGKDLSDTEAVNMISCVDVNHDGAVDFKEFLSLYQTQRSVTGDAKEEKDDADTSVPTQTEEQEGDDEGLLLEAFRVFDRNHDGFISAQELQAVLINLGMPEGKSLMSCEEMIHNVDRNGDGQCDILEFQELMSARNL